MLKVLSIRMVLSQSFKTVSVKVVETWLLMTYGVGLNSLAVIVTVYTPTSAYDVVIILNLLFDVSKVIQEGVTVNPPFK